jgi:uncharacterized protein
MIKKIGKGTKKEENPFLISGYKSAKYFCNRLKETDKLLSAINNGRNVTLYSLRRMGKTGLIHHTFNSLKRQKKIKTVYCDIYLTQNLSEFVSAFANAVFNSLESSPEKFFKKAIEVFKSIKPKVSADRFSGEPVLEFSLDSTVDAKHTIKEIFSYLNQKSGSEKIIIAIDEFQQIINFPESNIEAVLRTEIQALNNVGFIFSGSKKHMMHSIFLNSGRPFYQSTEMMNLNRIEKGDYREFISDKFADEGIKIDNLSIDKVLAFTNSYTYYVQFLCNKLYSNYRSVIEVNAVNETIEQVLEENENIFLEYRNLLTVSQWNLLAGIAGEKGIKSVTSMDFIRKYGLTAPSSVSNSVKSLLEKEMIYFEEGKYYVYDLFFSRWLERL